MAITSKNHSSPAPKHFASGSFKDTGTVKKSIISLGFVPKYFELVDATTQAVYKVMDGMAAATALKIADDGTLTLEASGMPTLGEIDSGTASTWTVYEEATIPVGTSSVGWPPEAAVENTDNSRLNNANEVFYGVSIPAALIASSSQAYWVAWA